MNKINVTISGRACTLKFTMFAMEMMQQAPKGNEYDSVIAMVWGGLNGWARVSNTDVPVTFEDVTDFVEDALLSSPEIITQINVCMVEGNAYKTLIKMVDEDAPKKKKNQTGTK